MSPSGGMFGGVIVVLGVIALAFLVLLTVGAVSGRVTLTSCCSVADPRRDSRMRAAFEQGAESAQLGRRTAAGTDPARSTGSPASAGPPANTGITCPPRLG